MGFDIRQSLLIPLCSAHDSIDDCFEKAGYMTSSDGGVLLAARSTD